MLDSDAQKRYEAFWAREAYGRCCLFLTVPKYDRLPPDPADPAGLWEDIEARFVREKFIHQNTEYLADSFPSVFTNYGPGCLTAMIGGTQKWAPETVWFENEPVIVDWDYPPAPVLDRESHMHRLVEKFTQTFLERGEGRFLLSVTDIGGTYDIISALRGTQTLLADLYDCPGEVKAFADELFPVWRDYFQGQSARLLKKQGAMTSWMPIYSQKTYYPLQCDFSAMISPRMFAEFIRPDLQRQMMCMDRSIYHLDGPDEIRHLDQLLNMERLNAIQWTSGAGAADVTDPCWFGLYERIQLAGKGLVLLDANPETVERLLRSVSPKGLFVQTSTRDIKQAQEIVAIADEAGRV